MPVGTALIDWDNKMGPVLLNTYPKTFLIEKNIINKILMAHSISQETATDFIELNVAGKIYMSYCDSQAVAKIGYRMLLIVFAEEEENIQSYKESLKKIGEKINSADPAEMHDIFIEFGKRIFQKITARKVILLGLPNVGKTSIKKYFFDNVSPEKLLMNPEETTLQAQHHVYRWMDLDLGVVDLPGQELDEFLQDDGPNDFIFNGVDAFIYVLDKEGINSNQQEISNHLNKILNKINQINNNYNYNNNDNNERLNKLKKSSNFSNFSNNNNSPNDPNGSNVNNNNKNSLIFMKSAQKIPLFILVHKIDLCSPQEIQYTKGIIKKFVSDYDYTYIFNSSIKPGYEFHTRMALQRIFNYLSVKSSKIDRVIHNIVEKHRNITVSLLNDEGDLIFHQSGSNIPLGEIHSLKNFISGIFNYIRFKKIELSNFFLNASPSLTILCDKTEVHEFQYILITSKDKKENVSELQHIKNQICSNFN